MSDELLTRAARALRESHDGESEAATVTRARVVLLATTRRKRRRFAVVVLPLAAAFALSTAWAAMTGRLPRWLSLLRGHDEQAQVGTSGARAVPPPAPLPPVASTANTSNDAGPDDDAAVEPGTSSALAQAAAAPTAPLPSVRGRAVPPGVPTASSTAATSAASEEEQLFAAAQHQHFVARDPQAALRAWDAYLAAYPKGRLALEARYNRALTLVRLGRTVEARSALQPFAMGREGSYRQREASDLLRALDGGAP